MWNLVSDHTVINCEAINTLIKLQWAILLYKSQQDAHVTEFILSDSCYTCFGRYYHPSSRAQTTATTASGNRYTVLLSAAIGEAYATHNTLKPVPTLPR
jgi:hypothetical protein